MAKELIFMGKRDGRVRLALFDSTDGTARRLPVKEISEEAFIDGIKAESLPVKGFGVNRGRVTCKYGDWYKLPDVGEGNTFTIFGLTNFGYLQSDDDGYLSDLPSGYYNLEQLKCFGLATVEWSTGTFRVMSPGTYWVLSERDVHFYSCVGALTKNKIQPRGEALKTLEEDADYVFKECRPTETIEEISLWTGIPKHSNYVFLQWLFQKCERIGFRSTVDHTVLSYITRSHSGYTPRIVMLGELPLDYIELPAQTTCLAIRTNRKVGLVRSGANHDLELEGFNDIDLEAPYLSELELTSGSRVRLLSREGSNPLRIRGWEGYLGSGGDYTGLNIDTLSSCFNMQPEDSKILVDASVLRNCFCRLINIDVELTSTPMEVTGSFTGFIGSLRASMLPKIDGSFNGTKLMNPLDLRGTKSIDNAVNNFMGDIILPESFEYVSGRVFQETSVRDITVKLAELSNVRGKRTVSITNGNLNLYLENLNADIPVIFKYGELANLYYTTPEGSISPKFEYSSVLPNAPVKEIHELQVETFKDVYGATLDFSIFPGVSIVPSEAVVGCNFSSVIFGPSIRKIEAGAFKDCDSIRWVYIPETVTDIDIFIRRPRVPYTICTQEGSAADTFAKKYNIEVVYVDSPVAFKQKIAEVPEEMEGAVAVAILTGAEDGEDAAILQACESTPYASDLAKVFSVKEKTQVPVSDVKWIVEKDFGIFKAGSDLDFSPRVQAVIATISNEAELNEDILKIEDASIFQGYSNYGAYRSGDTAMLYAELKTSHPYSDIVWVVIKGATIINAFTERISGLRSSCGIRTLLEGASKSDTDGDEPTQLSNLVEHLNFNSRGVSVRGKQLKSATGTKVYEALKRTYPLIGVYKGEGNSRSFIGVDIVNATYVAFKLSAGVIVDDGGQKYPKGLSWGMARTSIGGVEAKGLETLEGYTRMYSLIGESDGILKACMGIDQKKCQDYDRTQPLAEIEQLKVINTVLSGRGPSTVSVAEMRKALRTCGLTSVLSAKAWEKQKSRISYTNDTDYHLMDGKITVQSGRYENVTWITLSDGSNYVLCLDSYYYDVIRAILSVYNNGFEGVGFHEGHYALIDKALPASDFVSIRHFSSGGTYSRGGTIEVSILLSKISGKICVAAVYSSSVIPLYWLNSIADAVKVTELFGFAPFSPRQEWTYKDVESLTTGIFANESEYLEEAPSFKYAPIGIRHTRQDLKRGECDGYACPNGHPEVFNLAVKSPQTTDYK